MITISRRVQFAAGHRVAGHESKCRNLHGHNYVVHIWATAPQLDPLGRIIDFGVLKEVVGGWIDKELDHTFLVWKNDPLLHAILAASNPPEGEGKPVLVMEDNPTAENIAKLIFEKGNALLSDTEVRLLKVEVEETENCRAVYQPSGVIPSSKQLALFQRVGSIGSGRQRKVLLVGQRANGPMLSGPRKVEWLADARYITRLGAFRHGPSTRRLLKMGLRWDVSANLLPQRPRHLDTWDAADKALAYKAALSLIRYAYKHDMDIVCAGAVVLEAFTYCTAGMLKGLHSLHPIRILSLPHPSPRSYTWNDPEVTDKCVAAIDRFMKEMD